MSFKEGVRWQFVDRENWLVLFFSIIGVFFVFYRAKKDFAKEGLLVVWYIVSLFLSIVGIYPSFYRFLLFFPTGIFAGCGVYYSVKYTFSLRKSSPSS